MRLSLFSGVVFGILSIGCVLLKFYTTEIRFEEDPTVMIVLKDSPSLINRQIISGWQSVEGMTILIRDENGYIGMSVYAAIVSWVWMVLPLLTIIFSMGRKIWILSHRLDARQAESGKVGITH